MMGYYFYSVINWISFKPRHRPLQLQVLPEPKRDTHHCLSSLCRTTKTCLHRP